MTRSPHADAHEPFLLERPPIGDSVSHVVQVSARGGWAAFIAALTRLLIRSSGEGLWWATIDLADQRTPAFSHLGPDEGGRLWTEVSGEAHLPAGFRLAESQLVELRRLGWSDPLEEDGMRNHHRSWPAAELPDAVAHTVHTLVEVFGYREDDLVRVTVEPFR